MSNPLSSIEQKNLAAVRKDGRAIMEIKNPSEAVQLAAVMENGWAIQDIENPSEAVQLAAVCFDGWAIDFIPDPSEAVQLASFLSGCVFGVETERPFWDETPPTALDLVRVIQEAPWPIDLNTHVSNGPPDHQVKIFKGMFGILCDQPLADILVLGRVAPWLFRNNALTPLLERAVLLEAAAPARDGSSPRLM